MNQIRISLFMLIMSLAAQSNVYGSQTQVDLYKAYNMNMGYFGNDSHGQSMDKRMAQKNLINAPTAGEEGYKFVEKALQCNDINVNAQNIHGNTVLHTAVTHERLDIVKLLLEKRPDLNVDLKTPLKIIMHPNSQVSRIGYDAKDAQAIIALLIASGATCPELQNVNDLVLFLYGNDGLARWKSDPPGDEISEQYASAYEKIKQAYNAGKEVLEQREEERAAYEQEVASQIDPHIPVKDLNNIIGEYNRMSILQFVHWQKQQTQTTEEKTN